MAPRFALVTGAGSGIGRAVARALAREGWTLALLGRREAPLRETLADGLALVADVADEAQVDAAFASLRARFGRLDLLFNNAGIGAPAVPVDELTPAQWRAVVDTNLTGSFLCARAAFALMRTQAPRGGRIINNGSISAYAPRPFSAPYTATKHAISGLTKSLSLDGRAFDIACGQIDIGNVRTEMTVPMTKGMLQPGGEYKVEPVFELQQVVDALLYMAALPPDANVQFMTIMATAMPFIGRG